MCLPTVTVPPVPTLPTVPTVPTVATVPPVLGWAPTLQISVFTICTPPPSSDPVRNSIQIQLAQVGGGGGQTFISANLQDIDFHPHQLFKYALNEKRRFVRILESCISQKEPQKLKWNVYT